MAKVNVLEMYVKVMAHILDQKYGSSKKYSSHMQNMKACCDSKVMQKIKRKI